MGKVYFSYVRCFLVIIVKNDKKLCEMNKNDKIKARKDLYFVLNLENTCL